MRRRDGNKKRRVERQEQAKERQAQYDAITRQLEAEGKLGGVRLA